MKAYCLGCKTKQTIKDEVVSEDRGGEEQTHLSIKGVCPECDKTMFRIIKD